MNGPKAFIEHSNNMQDVYKNLDKYNLVKKRKILIVFDDMIANIISNKNLNSAQWNFSKADTYGTDVFVCFREVSTLERFKLKSSQI